MIADRPLLGILLMLLFCLLAPVGDAMAKLIGASVPLALLVGLRFAVQLAVLMPLVLMSGRSLRLDRQQFWLTALRTALHIAGIGAMFLSLRFLPLADAVAIAFVMPFILLLLAHFILHEEVGSRRLAACGVGFAGTLLVVQPSFAAVGAPALLPLLVAVVFALFMLVTRHMAKALDALVLQAVNGAMAVAMLAPVLLLGLATGWAEIAPAMPSARDWGLILAMGLVGTAAHLMMTLSLRFAPASTLAPMQYIEIPFATAVGWIVFRDFPNRLALIGILVTVAAGLYIVLRERALSRARSGP